MLDSKLANRPIADYFGQDLSMSMHFIRHTKDFEETYKQYQDIFVWIIKDSAEHSEPHIDACVTALASLVIECLAIKTSPLLTEESFGQLLAEMKEQKKVGKIH